jgi:hypothetical protein
MKDARAYLRRERPVPPLPHTSRVLLSHGPALLWRVDLVLRPGTTSTHQALTSTAIAADTLGRHETAADTRPRHLIELELCLVTAARHSSFTPHFSSPSLARSCFTLEGRPGPQAGHDQHSLSGIKR